jgi:hypothetical protein
MFIYSFSCFNRFQVPEDNLAKGDAKAESEERSESPEMLVKHPLQVGLYGSWS